MAMVVNRSSRPVREWPCGCTAERHLCPDAVRLWQETIDAFSRVAADRSRYRSACEAFDRHYALQEGLRTGQGLR